MNGTETIIPVYEPVSAFVLQLIASVIGAGVGAGFGFYLVKEHERKKDHEENKKTRIHILNAILEELKEYKENADSDEYGQLKWNSHAREFQGFYGTVSRPAYDSAVNSGKFILLSPEIQTTIGQVYLKLETMHDHNIMIRRFPSSSSYITSGRDFEAGRLADQSNRLLGEVRTILGESIPKIESELTTLTDSDNNSSI